MFIVVRIFEIYLVTQFLYKVKLSGMVHYALEINLYKKSDYSFACLYTP
jgi:hypothetical protein